jgi:ABC-type lipoprotein release transport system permease subunit
MRFADMLRLSFSALWQQKARTSLTVAGIGIGTVVLAVTLSVEQGFQDEVKRQLRHGDQLRQIWVFPDKALLTDATVAKLRALPHVESVAPLGSKVADVHLSRDRLSPEQVAMAVGLAAAPQGQGPLRALQPLLPWVTQAYVFVARPNDEHLRDRIIAGRYLSSGDANEVLLGQETVQELALSRGQPAQWLVGQKLHVVFPSLWRNQMELNRLLQLVNQVLAPSESRAVRKVLVRLWEQGNRSILTAHERDVIEKIVRRELEGPPAAVPGKGSAVPGKDMVIPGKDGALPGKDAIFTAKDEDERAVLAKVRKEIKAAGADLKLTKRDRAALERSLLRYLGEPQALSPGQTPFHEELVIVGVLRNHTKEDENLGLRLAAQTDRIDVFLSPATTERLFRRSPSWQELGYPGVFITVDSEENMKEVVAAVNDLGLHERSLVEYVDRLALGLKLERFLISFLALLGAIAAALGIINIMGMSVMERTREIGVMKAVGARDRDVQMIFLVEGAWLGVLGGGLGVLTAWLVSFPGDAYARQIAEQFKFDTSLMRHSLFVFPWWLVLGIPSATAVVTTLAGVFPARRAAKVDPIQALRHE